MKLKSCAVLFLTVLSCKSTSPLGESSLAKDELSPKPKDKKALGLSMNDVSILFPNHQNPAFLAAMPKLSEGFVPAWAGQELANNFQDLPTGDKTVAGPGRFQADLSPYKLAAIRLDPCANDLQAKGDDTLCFRQIRATWQIQDRQLGPFAMDSNVHTAYHVTRQEFEAILKTMKELHANATIDTTLLPLGVHPVIQKEGPESPYLKGVLTLLKTFAIPERLTVVAGMRRADFETWTMTTFSQDLKTQSIVQNNLIGVVAEPHKTLQKTQSFAVNRQKATSFMFARPASSHPDAINVEAFETLPKAWAFENPRLHNPLTTDCSSCHQAAHISANPDFLKRLESEKEFSREKLYTHPTYKLDPAISDARDKSALQMFAFSAGKPRVTARVVNETAHVLEYIEKVYSTEQE